MNITNRANFLSEVANLLEVDVSQLNDNFDLTRCATWDSLTVVSVIGLLDTTFGINVSIEIIEKIKTIKQLMVLTQQKENNLLVGIN